MYESVAVVGATQNGILAYRPSCRSPAKFPFRHDQVPRLRALGGQSRSRFRGRQHAVRGIAARGFRRSATGHWQHAGRRGARLYPGAVARGCCVVDESGFWRMDPKVPLVVPEVNPHAICQHQGIIASPNCSTTQMVVALKPLHDAGRVRRVVVSTYQATSGAGLSGTRDLTAARAPACRPGVRVRNLRPPDRLQRHPADRLAQAPGLHFGRNEDGARDPQDPGGRHDPGLPDLRPRAGGQLPQREHSGGDREKDQRRRSAAAVRRHAGDGSNGRPQKKVYPMP